MFTIIRPTDVSSCITLSGYESLPNLLKLPGTILPWQFKECTYNISLSFHDDVEKTKDIGNMLHEAGHGLARWYENKKERLLDIEDAIKFVQHVENDQAFGKKAGLHEARAMAFSYLLSDAVEAEYPKVYDYPVSDRCNAGVSAGFCAMVAYGYNIFNDTTFDSTKEEKIFSDEMDKIQSEFTPDQVVAMWQELCAFVNEGHTQEFIDESYRRVKEIS